MCNFIVGMDGVKIVVSENDETYSVYAYEVDNKVYSSIPITTNLMAEVVELILKTGRYSVDFVSKASINVLLSIISDIYSENFLLGLVNTNENGCLVDGYTHFEIK